MICLVVDVECADPVTACVIGFGIAFSRNNIIRTHRLNRNLDGCTRE